MSNRDVAAFPLRTCQCWMLVSRFPFPLTLPGITSASYRESRQRWKMGLAKRGKVDRSRGNKDSGDLCPDKRESSILIRVCMFVCLCTFFSGTYVFQTYTCTFLFEEKHATV